MKNVHLDGFDKPLPSASLLNLIGQENLINLLSDCLKTFEKNSMCGMCRRLELDLAACHADHTK